LAISGLKSIKVKLIVPIAVFTVATAVFNATYYPAIKLERIGAQFREKLDATLNTLVLGLEISFSSGNLGGARQTAEMLKQDRDLALLVVWDDSQNELLRHGSATVPASRLAALPLRTLREVDGHMQLKDEIIVDGEVFGTAIVGLSIAEREAAELRSWRVALFMTVALVSVGVLLLLLVNSSTRPILQSPTRPKPSPRVTSTNDCPSTATTRSANWPELSVSWSIVSAASPLPPTS